MQRILTVILICLAFLTNAQSSSRTYVSHSEENGRFQVVTNDGTYTFTPYSQDIMETSFVPSGETPDLRSHAVVMKPEQLETSYSYVGNTITFGTGGVQVSIVTAPFQIKYSHKGRPLISEKRGYVADSLKTLEFNLSKQEVLYGGGARALGMNRRGNRLQLYNRAHYGYEERSELMNFTMPIVLSNKRYAIHFDNAPIGFLDLDSQGDNTLKYETISGRMTYQIIIGDNWKELLDNYTDLTGKQPMPPRWALGNFASRFGYHTEKETRETINKFIMDDIPVDAVILDLFWFGKDIQGHMGNLEFDAKAFPSPKKMVQDFEKKGIKTILITEPFILTTSNRWDEAVAEEALAVNKEGEPYRYDFYFGNTGIVDIYKKEGADWFWGIYKAFIEDYGFEGWWGDLGEPEVHPSDLQHAKGSADEVHNIYGHDWARLIYEGYQKDFPEIRPFILMRAGYSGSQRFGMIPWSGDVNRSWGGFQPQPEIALQMGMQGMGFMHSDLGGFAGDYKDDELYTRWLQYGVFQPIFRPHAQESVPSEPVYKSKETKALAKKAIELRYRMLPYNYTAVFQNHRDGTPLMRPLFFEDDSKRTTTMANTYFWGDDFLVSPIMKKGETTHEVYFPKGSNWIDFYSGKNYKGGTNATVKVEEDRIPTFVRAGAFIPMTKPVPSTEYYDTKAITVHYYHDETLNSSKGMMYDDDGKTPNAFEKQSYEILRFASANKKKTLVIDLKQEVGANYESVNRKITLVIHGAEKPKKVKVDGKRTAYEWDRQSKTTTLYIDMKDTQKKITLKK